MNETGNSTAHVNLADVAQLGPPPPGNLAVPVFAHGTLEVEWYAPGTDDGQQPHDRDEVYVVARGTAAFWDGRGRHNASAGTFLFVEAGRPHRFELMSPAFGVWVFFYGPAGGEPA